MDREPSSTGPARPDVVSVDAATARLLAAVLGLGADQVSQVRDASPTRRHPLRQSGPVLDVGD